jgi:hypothetical protein
MAVDRRWNLVKANDAVWRLAQFVDVDPALLEPPINAVRASLHPRGLGPLIANLEGWRAFFRERLRRQYSLTGDEALAELLAELETYSADEEADADPASGGVLGPLKVRTPDGGRELSFIPMFAGFDNPFEVTTSELAIEMLFPADEATAEVLQNV